MIIFCHCHLLLSANIKVNNSSSPMENPVIYCCNSAFREKVGAKPFFLRSLKKIASFRLVNTYFIIYIPGLTIWTKSTYCHPINECEMIIYDVWEFVSETIALAMHTIHRNNRCPEEGGKRASDRMHHQCSLPSLCVDHEEVMKNSETLTHYKSYYQTHNTNKSTNRFIYTSLHNIYNSSHTLSCV